MRKVSHKTLKHYANRLILDAEANIEEQELARQQEPVKNKLRKAVSFMLEYVHKITYSIGEILKKILKKTASLAINHPLLFAFLVGAMARLVKLSYSLFKLNKEYDLPSLFRDLFVTIKAQCYARDTPEEIILRQGARNAQNAKREWFSKTASGYRRPRQAEVVSSGEWVKTKPVYSRSKAAEVKMLTGGSL